MLSEKLKSTPVVPLIQADDPEVAVRTVAALQAGGLDIIEVVLRTDAALDCLEAIAEKTTDTYVGAGTVLSLEQAQEAVRRGAQFIGSSSVGHCFLYPESSPVDHRLRCVIPSRLDFHSDCG